VIELLIGDEDLFEEEDEWFIEDEYKNEAEALNFFFKNKSNKLKQLIKDLEEQYEREDIIHILALYELLVNKANSVDIINEALMKLEKDKDNLSAGQKEIGIVLADELKNFYTDIKDIERLNILIVKFIVAYYNDSDYFTANTGNLEKIVFIIIEVNKWFEKNVKLDKNEKIKIDIIILCVISSISFFDIKNKQQRELIVRYFIKLFWNIREFVNVKSFFSSLFKGINWNYFKIVNKGRDKNIIKYLTKMGVEEDIAIQLVDNYLKNKEKD